MQRWNEISHLLTSPATRFTGTWIFCFVFFLGCSNKIRIMISRLRVLLRSFSLFFLRRLSFLMIFYDLYIVDECISVQYLSSFSIQSWHTFSSTYNGSTLLIPPFFFRSTLYLEGEPFVQCPRRALIRQCQRAKNMGYELKAGLEREWTNSFKTRLR